MFSTVSGLVPWVVEIGRVAARVTPPCASPPPAEADALDDAGAEALDEAGAEAFDDAGAEALDDAGAEVAAEEAPGAPVVDFAFEPLELEQAAALSANTPTAAPATVLRSIGTSPNRSAVADEPKQCGLALELLATQGLWVSRGPTDPPAPGT